MAMMINTKPKAAAGSYFPFLKLPGEIRNNIYEKLSEPDNQHMIKIIGAKSTLSSFIHETGKKLATVRRKSSVLGLRMVNRQLCREATPYILDTLTYGLFLRGVEEKRYSMPHILKQIDSFTMVFRSRLESIKHLELGLDSLHDFVDGTLTTRPVHVTPGQAPSQFTKLMVDFLDMIDGHPRRSYRDFNMTQLMAPLEALKPKETLPNVQTITLHSSAPDQFMVAYSQSDQGNRLAAARTELFISILKALFPKLADLRILTAGKAAKVERFCIASAQWDEDGRWCTGQVRAWYTDEVVAAWRLSWRGMTGTSGEITEKAIQWLSRSR